MFEKPPSLVTSFTMKNKVVCFSSTQPHRLRRTSCGLGSHLTVRTKTVKLECIASEPNCFYVRRTRFELVKAMPVDLQSTPVDRLGTDAKRTCLKKDHYRIQEKGIKYNPVAKFCIL